MSDPRSHFADFKNSNISIDDLDDEVLGAGGIGGILPFLGAIGGLLGGGQSSGQSGGDQNQQMMQMQMMQMQMQAQQKAEEAKRNQMLMFAGIGVAALAALFFVVRRS